MSVHSFSGGPSHILAELEIDPSGLYGTGELEYPRLMWQFHIHFQPPRVANTDYAFRIALAQLFLGGQKIADSHPVLLSTVMHWGDAHAGMECPIFEFPLNELRLQQFESRWQNGYLTLQLWMELQVDEFGILPASKERNRPAVWGVRHTYVLRLQQEFRVSRTDWVQNVLPRVGVGRVVALEFPAMSLPAGSAQDQSFKALEQAVEKHRSGFYDDAVGKCRVALESFFEQELVDPDNKDSRRVPVLKRSWETKLGKATYDWLSGALSALKEPGNIAHHSPNCHYDQLQSQMIIGIATAVVVYAGRQDVPSPPCAKSNCYPRGNIVVPKGVLPDGSCFG